MAGDRPMGLGRQQREWLMKNTYKSFIQEVQVVETILNNRRCLQDVAWRDGEDERGGGEVGSRGVKETAECHKMHWWRGRKELDARVRGPKARPRYTPLR